MTLSSNFRVLRRSLTDWSPSRWGGWSIALLIVVLIGAGSIDRANAGDLQTRDGNHVRLTSDVVDGETLGELVASFDAAVPQWLEFWGVPAARAANWKIDGYLMKNADTFRSMGALPPQVPRFQFGFASPTAVWVHHQSSLYYNRHLLLHEGVHSLSIHLFGGGGPSWYMEGTADLLATHRDRPAMTAPNSGAAVGFLAQADRGFRINELPRDSDESPMWGRYRVVDESRQAGTLPSLESVLRLPVDLQGDVRTYTWCWAAALMLTAYPDTREGYIAAAARGRDQSPAFTADLFRQWGNDWPVIRARWQLWLHDLEYGFDRSRSLVDLSTDDPRYGGQPLAINVDAAGGWQSAGVWFPQGTRLAIDADGQCVIVAKENVRDDETENAADGVIERDWISTPSGISVHRHRGQPVGQLQLCILPIPADDTKQIASLNVLTPTRIATPNAASATRVRFTGDDQQSPSLLTIDRPSWLLFRVHDTPGDRSRWQRSDNRGGYQVRVVPAG